MGFIDRAKKLADQAQKKLDDRQDQWNEGQSTTAGTAPRMPDPPTPESVPAPPVPDDPVTEGGAAADADATPDPLRPIQ